MHTETNLVDGTNGGEAEAWLWKQWANVLRVRNAESMLDVSALKDLLGAADRRLYPGDVAKLVARA
ncbi:hypothetical protein [Phenylobacterium sp.]|uniref:hypothetical protein n=1 Tax=Phenylobacterium sp. TaxID=1871053 RepID=UPI0025FC05A1|nr:hypothetical protein [Phenylobacterium sp.]